MPGCRYILLGSLNWAVALLTLVIDVVFIETNKVANISVSEHFLWSPTEEESQEFFLDFLEHSV